MIHYFFGFQRKTVILKVNFRIFCPSVLLFLGRSLCSSLKDRPLCVSVPTPRSQCLPWQALLVCQLVLSLRFMTVWEFHLSRDDKVVFCPSLSVPQAPPHTKSLLPVGPEKPPLRTVLLLLLHRSWGKLSWKSWAALDSRLDWRWLSRSRCSRRAHCPHGPGVYCTTPQGGFETGLGNVG